MKKQKVWFITGASKGFGYEIAKAALGEGDKVIATIRSHADSIKKKLGNNPNLLEVRLDVTDEKRVIAGVKEGIDFFGRIDVVVNNAGYGIVGGIEETSDVEVKAQYDTNVFGLLNVVRAVLPVLRKQGSGHIINTSSLFVFDVLEGWALYASTKFAVEGISQGLAKELKPFGIKVTVIEPGLFTTEFTAKNSYKIAANAIEAYKETIVGHMRSGTDGFHGTQPGDPAKLAQVVIQLVNADQPPLHLPIGPDAVALYRLKAEQIAGDVESWLDVSLSTDHIKN